MTPYSWGMTDPVRDARVVFALAWVGFGMRTALSGMRLVDGDDLAFLCFMIMLAGFGGAVAWTGGRAAKVLGVVGGVVGVVAGIGQLGLQDQAFVWGFGVMAMMGAIILLAEGWSVITSPR
ncbi:hypothetical protein HMPREF1531_01947 [Propionibacterium sp. oral taxon 192 str. F0372]|nr:hypothetical protein HMPREF1531_01947 [Propionibacterium sp. oral taxon 192 str. F0372]